MSPKLAKGEIGSLSGAADDIRFFQISVPVQPGNSGGALLDDHGNVIGVVESKLSLKAALQQTGQVPENVNYAIKGSYLLSLIDSAPGLAERLVKTNTDVLSFEQAVEAAREFAVDGACVLKQSHQPAGIQQVVSGQRVGKMVVSLKKVLLSNSLIPRRNGSRAGQNTERDSTKSRLGK